MDKISISGTSTVHCELTIDEPALVQVLNAHAEDEWPEVIARVMAVGAHTLLTAGLSVDLGDVDATVRRAIAEATAEAEHRVEVLMEAARATLANDLDPGHRDSILGKALDDFHSWRQTTLAHLDPAVADSSAARLLGGLADQLAEFETRLTTVFDPAADGSGFSALSAQMEALFRQVFTELGRDQGRLQEAERGTAKGVDFEDAVEEQLREVARSVGGCIVERTGRRGGHLGPDVKVGDFVLTLPSGRSVVIEVKHQARLSLRGANGILEELERAMANRGGDIAVCISAQDAFPAEVGSFARFGDAVLVVADSESPLLGAAVRWAMALADDATAGDGTSVTALTSAMERVQAKTRQLSDAKRALTEVGKSVQQVRDALDGLRRELTEIVDDALAAAHRDAGRQAA